MLKGNDRFFVFGNILSDIEVYLGAEVWHFETPLQSKRGYIAQK
jgi:hypothetical protein